MWWLAWFACARPNPTCSAGFELHADGMCYALVAGDTAAADTAGEASGAGDSGGSDTGATVQDVLDGLPPCQPTAADGRIDVARACVDGACTGDHLDAFEAVLGTDVSCESMYYDLGGLVSSFVDCTWSTLGVSAAFADADLDGEADPTAGGTDLRVDLPFDGGTTEGLGPGATMRCFVDRYGAPDYLSFESDGAGGYDVYSMAWHLEGLYVYDYRVNRTGTWGRDGEADQMELFGASRR